MAEQNNKVETQRISCTEHRVHQCATDTCPLVFWDHSEWPEPDRAPDIKRAGGADDMPDDDARVFGDQRQGRVPRNVVAKCANQPDLDRFGPGVWAENAARCTASPRS